MNQANHPFTHRSTRRLGACLACGLCLCCLLAGCAEPLGNGLVDWAHGARRARVLAVLDAQAGAAALHACAPSAPPATTYVRVRYRLARLHRSAVAPLPAGMTLAAGDEVELWPEDCDACQAARIERVLPAPAAGSPAAGKE
ncbi:hypothetical protein HH212_13835 [Massilia forsythiae]|uniref:Lipoprotein n=1 Tax=Massilia forsythiae TaxID=2728020 RepID=A0A7Z2VWY7_9BURK|nr:hypothetical protein [Massilia forsythiae]QJE00976.1 hypothetical protein HH212_13835 [Massilia forsythiae]